MGTFHPDFAPPCTYCGAPAVVLDHDKASR
jgi:hypothetical protein